MSITATEIQANSWHLTSFPLEEDCLETTFLNKVKDRLPPTSLPVKTGPTGYIMVTDNLNNSPEKCYSFDEFGRLVVKWNDRLMFQRSLGNSKIMGGKIDDKNPKLTICSDQVRQSELEKMINELN